MAVFMGRMAELTVCLKIRCFSSPRYAARALNSVEESGSGHWARGLRCTAHTTANEEEVQKFVLKGIASGYCILTGDRSQSLKETNNIPIINPVSRWAVVSSQPPLAGRWGGANIPPRLTSEPRGGARSARRRSKALNEEILMQSWNFLSKVKCWIKVGSKVKDDCFRLIGCWDQTRDCCKRKLCENATEGMTKMSCK